MNEKRVIYIKTATSVWMDFADYMLEYYAWKPVMWVGNTIGLPDDFKQRYPDAVFYDHMDAMRAFFPKNMNISANDPLDGPLLSALSDKEAIFLEMIERWSIDYDRTSYEDLRQYYLLMIRNWLRIIKSLDADLIVCPTIPHRIYDYAAYLVAKYIRIDFVMQYRTADICVKDDRLDGFSYAITDIEDRAADIYKNMKLGGKSATLSAGLEKYLKLAKGDYSQVTPSYFAEKESRMLERKPILRRMYNLFPFSARLYIQFLRKLVTRELWYPTGKLIFPSVTEKNIDYPAPASQFHVMREYMRTNIQSKKAIKWYQNNANEPDFNKPYIYYSPHFQPERSTCPDAGKYQTNELILETLAAALPAGWKIYYKEHPSNFRPPIRFDNNRRVSMYKRMLEICPALDFVPVRFDPFLLIDNSKAVAVATGTTGWEALARGVPPLVFGDVWYRRCPGVFYVKSVCECKQALDKIEKGVSISIENIRCYLKAVESVGFTHPYFWRDPLFHLLKNTDPERYWKRIGTLSKSFANALECKRKSASDLINDR